MSPFLPSLRSFVLVHHLPLPRSLKAPYLFSKVGGDDGIRTHDPLLAGQVLSQLSYTPVLGLLPFKKVLALIPKN